MRYRTLQLAEHFGFVSVKEMLQKISSYDISEWMAYFEVKHEKEEAETKKAQNK